jgi:hypothetical protein
MCVCTSGTNVQNIVYRLGDHPMLTEMRCCQISKEMSSSYFGLDVFCVFKAGVLEFDLVFRIQCIMYSPQLFGSRGCLSNSGALASNRQNTVSPKYNDDISLLISQYLFSAMRSSSRLKNPCMGIQSPLLLPERGSGWVWLNKWLIPKF